jgi:hypothetical protein
VVVIVEPLLEIEGMVDPDQVEGIGLVLNFTYIVSHSHNSDVPAHNLIMNDTFSGDLEYQYEYMSEERSLVLLDMNDTHVVMTYVVVVGKVRDSSSLCGTLALNYTGPTRGGRERL